MQYKAVWKSNFTARSAFAFVLNRRVALHAIDAMPDASLNCGEAARSFRASYGW